MGYVNLKYILNDAEEKGYGIGAFNFNGYEDVQGIINGAVKANSPVIVSASMSVVKYFGLRQLVGMVKGIANSVDIPVCLHLDHCTSVSLCKEAIAAGFSSVMYDGSLEPIEINIKNTKEVVKFAKKYGTSVEAEIGHVTGVEDGVGSDDNTELLLTDPKEALDFYNETKPDALAVAIGTVHGLYKKEPKLDFERIERIKNLIPVPLVVHGGTGLSNEDFKKCISLGMNKINIGTELKLSYINALKKEAFAVSEEEIDPKIIMKEVKNECEKVSLKYSKIFGSVNQV